MLCNCSNRSHLEIGPEANCCELYRDSSVFIVLRNSLTVYIIVVYLNVIHNKCLFESTKFSRTSPI
jgi:hypothetical protein